MFELFAEFENYKRTTKKELICIKQWKGGNWKSFTSVR